MLDLQDYARLDATAIAESVQTGRLSPVEVVEAALAAMKQLDPRLNAFCTPTPEVARAAAEALAARQRQGEKLGSLAGVPVAIKDLILTRDIRTTFGSRLYANYVPSEDDIAVERLKAADAIIIGKTNAAEFGYGGIGHNPLFATTRNPWNLERTSGGSSAGSAAAVAAGVCPVALGSDGGGSVRLPAAFCGLVGYKPTMGRIPLWPGCRDETLPGASGWESIEHYGPLSRSVRDSARFLRAVCGPDPRDRLSLPDDGVAWLDETPLPPGLRIAYCPRWADGPVDREVAARVGAAALVFASELGAFVEETPPPFGDFIVADRALIAMETDLTGMRRLIAERGEAVSPPLQALLDRDWSANEFADAIVARKSACNAMARFMHRYDLILTPAAPLVAFALDSYGPGEIDGQPVADDAWSPALYPANLTGQPAISVPCERNAEGLPIGLQIIGRRFDDALVLAAARAFERVRPWAHRHPPCSLWSEESPG